MLGVAIDLIIVIMMQASLEGMSDDWRDLIWPVLGITIGNAAIAFALGSALGLLTLIPMALLTFAILMLLCHMTPRNAIITTVVLIGAKLGLSLLFSR
jgi:uncharacterized membrane protein HdeD (DUF308 family)